MKELDVVNAIENREELDLKQVEGLDLGKSVCFAGFINTTIVHVMVEHNMLAELRYLMRNLSPGQVSFLLTQNTAPLYGHPAISLLSHILFAEHDSGYLNPDPYIDMICFVVSQSFDISPIRTFLSSRRGSEDESFALCVQELEHIIDECLTPSFVKNTSAVVGTTAPAAFDEALLDYGSSSL